VKRSTLITTGIGIAVTGAIAVVGQASATTGHPRTERFAIVSVSDPSTSTVIATGVFTAGGTDDSGASADHLAFPDGKLTLNHHGTHKTSVNARTCMITTTGSGTYTLADGTGAYKGISGSGHYTFRVHVVLARTTSGSCDRNADPAAFEYLVHGRGKVTP
jgi:hypothetical protein